MEPSGGLLSLPAVPFAEFNSGGGRDPSRSGHPENHAIADAYAVRVIAK